MNCIFIQWLHELKFQSGIFNTELNQSIADIQMRNWEKSTLIPYRKPKGWIFEYDTDQLHAIRKTSMARLICDNSDSISQIQPRVFLINDPFL